MVPYGWKCKQAWAVLQYFENYPTSFTTSYKVNFKMLSLLEVSANQGYTGHQIHVVNLAEQWKTYLNWDTQWGRDGKGGKLTIANILTGKKHGGISTLQNANYVLFFFNIFSIFLIFFSIIFSLKIALVLSLPEGSPILVVPPPNRTIGLCPCFCISLKHII